MEERDYGSALRQDLCCLSKKTRSVSQFDRGHTCQFPNGNDRMKASTTSFDESKLVI